jgi:hypothetical protein
MSYFLLHWHEVVYLLLAIIFVAAYVVHFLPGMKDSKFRKILEVETILLVVLVFVAVIAARVEKVANEMDKQAAYFNEIVDDALRGKGLAKIRQIESASDMYSEVIAAQERSTKEIRFARLWEKSTDDMLTGSPARVYKEIDEWLDADSGRVFYRVVNIADEGMEKWFEEECARKSESMNLGMKKIEGNRNIHRMSFAIFDDREVFLIARPLSGPFEATKTVHIEDPVFASFMVAYFDQIFEGATGCSGR